LKFTIAHPGFLSEPRYESLEQAREALRRGLGWSDIYLGPGYTTEDGKNQIWRAYPTPPPPEEASTENDGTPQITRLVEGV